MYVRLVSVSDGFLFDVVALRWTSVSVSRQPTVGLAGRGVDAALRLVGSSMTFWAIVNAWLVVLRLMLALVRQVNRCCGREVLWRNREKL